MSAVSDLFDRHDRPECGTPHGAARHHRDGEPACESCLEARREYQRELHEDTAARKLRPERTAVVAQMKALDAHRAARAALREQTRVDL